MAEKNIKARIQLKNDTEENWNKAVNFVPKQGEAIIYKNNLDHTFPRIKIGDGIQNVSSLPFINDVAIEQTLGTGTQIGILSINGIEKTIFAPRNPSIYAQVDDQNETLIISETDLSTDAPMTVQIMQGANTPIAEFIMSTNENSSALLKGVLSGTTPLSNGKIIYYMTKYNLPSTELSIQLKYGDSNTNTDVFPIYSYGNTRCKTPYPAGSFLILIYYNSAFYLIFNPPMVV